LQINPRDAEIKFWKMGADFQRLEPFLFPGKLFRNLSRFPVTVPQQPRFFWMIG
jgi:hypothetical protein